MSNLCEFVAKKCAKPVKMPLGEWLAKQDAPYYYVEPKWDGRRVFMFKTGNHIVLASKHNGVYTDKTHPDLFARKLDPSFFYYEKMILDGEFIPAKNEVHFFDILTAWGDFEADYVREKMPLHERKEVLNGMVPDSSLLTPYLRADTQQDIEFLFKVNVDKGFEGVVVKNPTSPYGEGWLKLKKKDTMDVVVLRKEEGKEHSWHVGVYTSKGDVIELGKVGTMVKEVNPNDIKLGSVVEVQFQEITKERKLREGFITRIRLDKIASECTDEQL